MYDIHSHVLFGIDDGAKTVEDAVALCRFAAEDGTQAIVATPHIRPDRWPNDRARIEGRLADLRHELERQEVPIEVILGSEIWFDPAMVPAVREGAYPTYADRRRYLLFELPNYFLRRQLQEIVFEFRTAGITPVLAHPERNDRVMEDVGALHELVRMGTLLQVTAMSLTGRFGRRARKGADQLMNEGLVHVVASDAHSLRSRPSGLGEAFRLVRGRFGDAVAHRLFVDNPHRIILGEEIDPTPQPLRRPGFRGLLDRLTIR